ncbi:hypothetical protein Ddye_027496 [Dipteronia dyeriana]|uniref:Uncharacterized protein n=1 Tax=Dipteronia dyeriana TaxID=168575 RepID=A0AAD9TPF0_9ROSI|nr:hypothetical protein Ddye_027496 [Dipteronia dyeriana]
MERQTEDVAAEKSSARSISAFLDELLFAGQTLVVDDPGGEFKVLAYDANHCPSNSFSGDLYCCCLVSLIYLLNSS